MQLCRFMYKNETFFGSICNGVINPIDGDPFSKYTINSLEISLSEVKLLVPVVPPTFYAIGSNYRNHIVGLAKNNNTKPIFYDKPRIGYRANSALIADKEKIIKPIDATDDFQYEGELVAVIGKKGKNLTPEQALDCIYGWTIGNDISERNWQKTDPTNLRSKNSDTFKPMGPWITTDIKFDEMRTIVRLNDKKIHDFPTSNMLFSPGEIIAEISKYNALSPGDVIWLGTDEIPLNLKNGDSIEIEISGIGTLENRVVSA